MQHSCENVYIYDVIICQLLLRLDNRQNACSIIQNMTDTCKLPLFFCKNLKLSPLFQIMSFKLNNNFFPGQHLIHSKFLPFYSISVVYFNMFEMYIVWLLYQCSKPSNLLFLIHIPPSILDFKKNANLVIIEPLRKYKQICCD